MRRNLPGWNSLNTTLDSDCKADEEGNGHFRCNPHFSMPAMWHIVYQVLNAGSTLSADASLDISSHTQPLKFCCRRQPPHTQ